MSHFNSQLSEKNIVRMTNGFPQLKYMMFLQRIYKFSK